MKENYTVCNCMQVNYSDIADVIDSNNNFESVLSAFDAVQNATQCSMGCGGCYQRVLDIISEIMMSK